MKPATISQKDPSQNSESIISSFKSNLDKWENRVQSLIKDKKAEKSPTLEEELQELKQLSDFLKGKLTSRLMSVKKYPEELRSKYLRCLEPFYTEEGIFRFMGYYFNVDVYNQTKLLYYHKRAMEKEINVLFDLYKVKKTIETITTLQNSVASDQPFPSRFSKAEQVEFLRTLKEIFKLFFLRFVKKEYQKQLYNSLSENQLKKDEIIKLRMSGTSYLQPEIFQNTEHRDKFITVFFSTLLRTKSGANVKDLHFNYLNFELLKNEFLTDWMLRKLKGNKEKDKILQNYKIGDKSVVELIRENPEKEEEFLQTLPICVCR